jgi:hypothetical protein
MYVLKFGMEAEINVKTLEYLKKVAEKNKK